MLLLDGKKTASEIRRELASEIAERKGGRGPGLAVIIVGDDPASQVYVRNKERACQEAGIDSFTYRLPKDTSNETLLGLIKYLNESNKIDGILLQLPLPQHLEARKCLLAISPEKDVDGFHPENMGRLALGLPGFQPCTPAGIIELLRRYNMDMQGKKAVVIGRSDIVGKPLALLLAQKNINATVTLCHSGTKNLRDECLKADFLFLALGKPEFITGDMISDGCVVVDVGINRGEKGLCGDGHFESLCKKSRAITPVPGGIGPMTIAMLLVNTVKAWKNNA